MQGPKGREECWVFGRGSDILVECLIGPIKNDVLVTAWSNMVHMFIHEIRTLVHYTRMLYLLLCYNGKTKLQVHAACLLL